LASGVELPMTDSDFVPSLFTGEPQHENFNRVNELLPTTTLKPSTNPYQFPTGAPLGLPASFNYEGEEIDTEGFLTEVDTAALLILTNGQVRLERYSLTGGIGVPWLSMSVAKSVVSALIGIAVDGGLMDIEEPVTLYVPSLAGSGYDGVRLNDVIQMSSGARWNEDYNDPESDIGRMAAAMAGFESLEKFVTRIQPQREAGTFNQYNSADTQVLGMALRNATGRSIADLTQTQLWDPLGMESTAYWMVDNDGVEMAFGGLNATARDYAKIGELFRNRGNWKGTQIVSADWVQASVTPDAPHLQYGVNNMSDDIMAYGYQWWLLDGDEGEYSAIGVYNQFIYVNPAKDLVIVKLSANRLYGTTDGEESNREMATFELFRAIGKSL
jgi:CubicO group peptidase (beta-lactamase class C family)